MFLVTQPDNAIPENPARGSIAGPLAGVGDETNSRISLRSWWMILILLTIYIFSMVDRRIISMVVVPIQKQLSLSDIQMGLILGPAFAVTNFLALVPFGWASDRWPRRWVLFFGIILWSIASAGSGFALSFVTLLIARALVGIGEASVNCTAYSMIGDGVPRARLTLALSVYQMGAKLSTAASFAAIALATLAAISIVGRGIPILGNMQPWQLTLILTGTPGIVFAFLLFTFPEPARKIGRIEMNAGNVDKSGFIRFLRIHWGVTTLMLTTVVCCAMAAYSLNAWVPTYMERKYGMGPLQYGPILSAISLVSAGGLILKGILADYLYQRGRRDAHLWLLSILLAISIPIAIISFTCNNAYIFLLGFALLELLVGQFFLYFAAPIQLFVPVPIRGQFTALLLAAMTLIGMGAGPLGVAFLTEKLFGDQQALGMSMLIFAVGTYGISFIAVRATQRKVQGLLIA